MQVGSALGYHGLGLGALTQRVLGHCPPKSRRVTMSNWEARGALSAAQLQYAALDAVLTGHVYRSLRRWHASPSACTSCRQMLGAVRALLLLLPCRLPACIDPWSCAHAALAPLFAPQTLARPTFSGYDDTLFSDLLYGGYSNRLSYSFGAQCFSIIPPHCIPCIPLHRCTALAMAAAGGGN